MSAYIATLKAEAIRHSIEALKREEAHAERVAERLTPVEDRLARLLATIPVEVQREGLSLTSLQASLKGRWRGNVHPGELGRALRKAGFVRRRDWRCRDGFRALWALSD